ncbi:ABC transporter permease [Staphylococcus simulans]|uniref:ABC-2 type transporter n=1 Tax=Staphylococcus simulans TaxID=1286 RepID=A0A6N2ZYG8_STASI|nr:MULTISPECIES: ABC transporter permease [Staphylococcus]MBO0386817.1 ABC transporter permease [Staphylococcus simulans]MBU6942929.1 ABC transporter permease [Staphylococcus sp. CWZ226]MDQ7116180.1 ABC transporter permease [Staphylococcus simulans]MDQ7139589.1 ABC transporter permease [Staphylococcus simulans]MDT4010674.1 ABC transporter permease [Staphylococcus simulans]
MIFKYLKLDWTITLRQKIYLILSVGMPLVFFLIFTSLTKVPQSEANQIYKESLMSMTVFSLTSYCLLTFPVELVQDKQNGWQKKLFATPMTPIKYYVAKVFKIMSLFLFSIILMFSVGGMIRHIHMSLYEWLVSGLLLWIGSSLFLSIGLLLAQHKDVKQASSIGNLLYIVLAIVGGLWFPISLFPQWLASISRYMPTYRLKQLGLDFIQHQTINIAALGFLLGYCILFIIIALVIQKKSDVM